MIKKIDGYIIKTFLGPFIFIFSVLFFIFIIQFAWTELDTYTGKGLTVFQILKFLFYLGITVIQFVLPLTILLASIMTFGGFGERYELAAIKSSGISLARIMAPLFFIVILMAIGLFFFSNNVIPTGQFKARNMLYNIIRTKPALNFEESKFINQIPGYTMKIDKISGEEKDQLTQIIIEKMAPISQDQRTIVAENGVLKPSENSLYLIFQLYDGFIYENKFEKKNLNELKKQNLEIIQFDTMTRYFDISELVKNAIEEENITDNYKFLTYSELDNKIDTFKNDNQEIFKSFNENYFSKSINSSLLFDSIDVQEYEYEPVLYIEDLEPEQKSEIAITAINQLQQNKNEIINSNKEIESRLAFINKSIIFQQNILTFSFTCVIFFLIGAPLGAIIRKGGIGLPVVIAIIIFVIFFSILTYSNNLSKTNLLNPYLAVWIPNLIVLPLGILFTLKAMYDSNLFDLNDYLDRMKNIFGKFSKSKNNEHSRYQ